MSNEISRLFTITGTLQRLSPDQSDADQEGWVNNGTCLGHLQPTRIEVTHMVEGALFKTFYWWCPLATDIKEHDRLIIDGDTYVVSGVDKWTMGSNPHAKALVQKGVGA